MQAEKRRMEASARLTCSFLGLHAGDTALLCMPLDFIAGKMMVVRAVTCGLRLLTVAPDGHPLAGVDEPVDFAAMVPLQVWNSLSVPLERERLRQVRHLLIGGGPVDDDLSAQLSCFPHHVWSTYGMTETLSHIALRRINGPDRSDWYTPLEGVSVSINGDSCLVVDAPAVHDGLLTTNDIVTLDGQRFRIVGRKDNVISTGGIKVQAEEVERLLRPHLHVPFLVSRAPDAKLGQQVVLLMEGGSASEVEALCRRILPKYWCPRRIVVVDHIPQTATGKPARSEAERLALS